MASSGSGKVITGKDLEALLGRLRAAWGACAESGWPDWALPAALYLVAFLSPILAFLTMQWNEQAAYERLAAQGANRLTLYGTALSSEMEKYRNIPLVLAEDPQVRGLLQHPDADSVRRLNPRLQTLSDEVGALAIYVLDRQGMTLAASNWADPQHGFVGHRFDFRPYFTEAMEGRPAHYYALGLASLEPGYYQTMPVSDGSAVIGAVVVKMTMDRLEKAWAGGAEMVFVTDPHGVVIVTNNPAWRFRSEWPLTAEAEAELRRSRQFGDIPIRPLGLVRGERLVTVDNRAYVMATKPFAGEWTLNVLMSVGEARARARDSGLVAALVMALAMAGLFFLLHRGRMARRHTRDLERRVAERTRELREQQEELVQAAKLAALGQMSAGMAHEVNQPLAALRGYADNAAAFLDRGRAERVRDNLREIVDLTERIAGITGQLKQFARKSSGNPVPVGVAAMVGGGLTLLQGRLRGEGVDLTWTPPADDLRVWGDEVRLQQVLVNLICNALDAMRGTATRRLTLAVVADEAAVTIGVRDSGPGIPENTLSRLFEPFFTTKPTGEGLGLGLCISERILRDLGGGLTGANHPEGGAVFTVTLRRVVP